MDDLISREVPFAEENIEPNGRPAINKFGNWTDGVSKTIHDRPGDDISHLSDEEREKRIKEMDEIIKKEIK